MAHLFTLRRCISEQEHVCNQTSELTGNAPYIKVISTHFGKGRKTERQSHHYLMFCEPKKTLMHTAVSRAGAQASHLRGGHSRSGSSSKYKGMFAKSTNLVALMCLLGFYAVLSAVY